MDKYHPHPFSGRGQIWSSDLWEPLQFLGVANSLGEGEVHVFFPTQIVCPFGRQRHPSVCFGVHDQETVRKNRLKTLCWYFLFQECLSLFVDNRQSSFQSIPGPKASPGSRVPGVSRNPQPGIPGRPPTQRKKKVGWSGNVVIFLFLWPKLLQEGFY